MGNSSVKTKGSSAYVLVKKTKQREKLKDKSFLDPSNCCCLLGFWLDSSSSPLNYGL